MSQAVLIGEKTDDRAIVRHAVSPLASTRVSSLNPTPPLFLQSGNWDRRFDLSVRAALDDIDPRPRNFRRNCIAPTAGPVLKLLEVTVCAEPADMSAAAGSDENSHLDGV